MCGWDHMLSVFVVTLLPSRFDDVVSACCSFSCSAASDSCSRAGEGVGQLPHPRWCASLAQPSTGKAPPSLHANVLSLAVPA